MAQELPLGSLVVQLIGKGLDQVRGQLGSVKDQITSAKTIVSGLRGEFQTLSTDSTKMLEGLAKQLGISRDGLAKMAVDGKGDVAKILDSLNTYANSFAALKGKAGESLDSISARLGLNRDQFAKLSEGAGGDLNKIASKLMDFSESFGRLKGVAGESLEQIARRLGMGKAAFAELEKAAGGDISKIAAGLERFRKESIEKTQASLKSFTTAATLAFAGASASILGFAKAGLAGTSHGERMSLMFGLINREISSLFLPTIDKIIHKLEQLFSYFRSLSGEQQDNARRWLEGAIAAGTLAIVLPRVFAGLSLVSAGVKALGAAIVGAEAATGIGALLPLIGLAISALTGLLLGTEKGRSALGELGEALAPVWEAIKPLISAVGELTTQMSEELAGVLKSLAPDIAKLVHELTPLVTMLLKAAAATSVAEWKLLAIAIEATLTPIAALAESINFLVEKFSDLVDAVNRLDPPDWVKWVVAPGFMGAKKLGLVDFGDVNPRDRKGEGTPRHDLMPAGGGFEDIRETYRRLSTAAVKTDTTDPNERTAKGVEAIVEILDRLGFRLDNFRPAVV